MANWRLIVGALIWIAILPFVALPFGLLVLYKFALGKIAKYSSIRGENGVDKLHLLEPVDCMLAADSSAKRPIVNFGFVLITKGKIGVEELRDHFKKCFLKEESNGDRYEKLYSHLETFGGYVFRATAETLDVNEHVVELEQIESSNLEEFLVKWVLKDWKPLKPCWELAVIPLDGETTGIAFKIHHAFADGYSLTHILDKLTGSTTPYLVKEFGESGLTQLKQIVEGPVHLSKLGGVEPSRNPFRVMLNPEKKGHEWLVGFTSVELKEVKQLRKKYGVKMSSVILTIISGALRKFLEEENGKMEIPEGFLVGMTLPWPRHPSQEAYTWNKNKLCNHWVVCLLKVPLREPKPELRIKAIDAQLHQWQVELGLDKFIGRVMQPIMWALPRFIIEKATGDDFGAGVGLTSLVGAEGGYTLLGKEVTTIHPWIAVPDSNPFSALSCFSFSHRGKLELTFGAHPSVFKDQKKLNHLCQKLVHDELQRFLRVK